MGCMGMLNAPRGVLWVVAVIWVQGSLAQGLGSPLKVAQCRAKCIHTFPGEESGANRCLKDPNCRTCWDQCQRLQAGWSAACDRNAVCRAGCRQACRFHLQLEVQRSPVLVTRGEEVIIMSGDTVSWPPGAGTPHVFVLMCRKADNTWSQVVQTLELSWRFEGGQSCSTVRVMVVGLDGLVTVYSPASRSLQDADVIMRSVGRDVWQGLGISQNKSLEINSLRSNSITEDNQVPGWNLREVSLIHQGVLVIAELAWDPQPSSAPGPAVYLVTWELAGGGLKGNLLTDSTCVTLSLWPDTVYRIQVQLIQEPQRLSEPLVLDTQAAPQLHSSHHPPAVLPVYGHPGFEGVAGAACAILLFLAVVLLATGRWRTAALDKNGDIDEHSSSDHFKLFPPPVTLLLDTPSPAYAPMLDVPDVPDVPTSLGASHVV